MQPPPVLSIPILSATNYADWFVACTTAAKKCLPTNGPLGGLGFILSTEEYTALNNGERFSPAEKPSVVTKTEQCHLQSVYDREQIALATLTNAIYDSIPEATRQACTGYSIRFGSSFIPLPIMMQHVANKFGDASVFSYQQAKAVLMHPYANGDIDEFLAAQLIPSCHSIVAMGNH